MGRSGTRTNATGGKGWRILWNGALLGFVLWLHLLSLLALMASRGRVPDDEAPGAADDRVMQVRFIPGAPTRWIAAEAHAVAPRATLPKPVRRVAKPSAHLPASPEVAAGDVFAAPTRTETVVQPAARQSGSDGYGDATVLKALAYGGAQAVPALPGADEGPLAGKFHAMPSPSLRDRVRSVGNYMNCSIVEIARNRPGQLNMVRIADAYAALGCKK
jgi:hypothetical protein